MGLAPPSESTRRLFCTKQLCAVQHKSTATDHVLVIGHQHSDSLKFSARGRLDHAEGLEPRQHVGDFVTENHDVMPLAGAILHVAPQHRFGAKAEAFENRDGGGLVDGHLRELKGSPSGADQIKPEDLGAYIDYDTASGMRVIKASLNPEDKTIRLEDIHGKSEVRDLASTGADDQSALALYTRPYLFYDEDEDLPQGFDAGLV